MTRQTAKAVRAIRRTTCNTEDIAGHCSPPGRTPAIGG
jgi:hypothetical protein